MKTNEDKKKKDVQISTIISSIEKEVNELLKDSQSRSMKIQLLSIKEILKILEKRLKNYNDLLLIEDENKRLKEEAKENKLAFNKELENLKNENIELKKFINGLPERFKVKLGNKDLTFNEKPEPKDESIKSYENKIAILNSQLKDEKTKTYKLNTHVTHLETTISKMKEEFEELVSSTHNRDNFNEDYERVINVYKKNNNDLKKKIEELTKINADLKQRFLDSENVLKDHTNDFKNLIKQNSTLQKKIEEYEKEKNNLTNDIMEKQNRLTIIRHMNNKLEQKSNKIVKKFENFKRFEEKSYQVSENCNKLISVIEELNEKINFKEEENLQLNQEIYDKKLENSNLKENLEELRTSLKLLENEKTIINEKYQELEKNLKRRLETDTLFNKDNSVKESREISNLKSKEMLNSKYFKSMNQSNNIPTTSSNNYTSSNLITSNYINTQNTNENIKIEELKPARIILNERNQIQIKN